MELVVIAFFFGLSAATIAKIKGSSFLLWFMVGFCLPLIGTIIALLWRNERVEDTGRRCPNCGRGLKAYDQVCMRCGLDL